ncbi:MAG TPA: hypothetical protein VFJ53_02735 [Solirubrobacterales bacterium]|nr:hypothetical protein [Solirubrobacterales bacterium]
MAAFVIALTIGGFIDLGRAAAAESCGTNTTFDWLCKEGGEVQIGRAHVRSGSPFQVSPKTRVWVDRAALARMVFGGQAICTLGGVGMPTVIVSRYRSSLFLQRNGSTSCAGLSGPEDKFGVFCHRTALCPVEVTVDGYVRTEWRPRPLSRSLRVGAQRREIVLWICAVSYRVAVRRSGNGSESSGESSGYTFPPAVSVVRITEFGSYGLGISGESTTEACDPQA